MLSVLHVKGSPLVALKTRLTSLHNASPQTWPQERALQTARLSTSGLLPHSPRHTHKGQAEDR